MTRVVWPGNKAFAFTVFDDPDAQTIERGKAAYDLLIDCGFRTTKAVWPVRGPGQPSDGAMTCAEPEYLKWALELQARGFEIGWHGATLHTSRREETIAGLDKFREYFGQYPAAMAQHFFCEENVYWGDGRVSGLNRLTYNLLTRWKNHRRFFGEASGHPYYWADICRQRIKYVRNFVFGDINTLKACPLLPYHDPARPCVNHWFASSEGANVESFNRCISEAAQDRLEQEGGACIMYAHFAHGFCPKGVLNGRFRDLMQRLARKNGWFVPVSTLLDYLLEQRGPVVISTAERRALERKWLLHKMRFGVA